MWGDSIGAGVVEHLSKKQLEEAEAAPPVDVVRRQDLIDDDGTDVHDVYVIDRPPAYQNRYSINL